MEIKNINSDSSIQEALQNVIEREGLTNKAVIHMETGPEAGEGFVGLYSVIKIEEDGRVLKLFVKAAPKDEKLRSQVCVQELFGREIYFYETVYPEFLKFQRDRKVTFPFTSVAKCYLTVNEDLNEILILENLKEQGYVSFNRDVDMNENHITFVLKLYARYHAVSYAMKDQDPQLFAKLSNCLNNFVTTLLQSVGFDQVCARYADEAKEIFDPVEDAYVLDRIQRLPEMVLETIANADQFVDAFSIISHGDSWSNNFLFKYEDVSQKTIVEDIKILDWQAMQLNSPVTDLSHFFYGVATKDAMAKLPFYLKTYHDALSENIREMGGDPEKLYPYSVLEEHWKKFSRFGLTLAFGILRVRFADKEEVPKPAESVAAGETFSSGLLCKLKNEELYKQRIRDIVEHFVYNDFI